MPRGRWWDLKRLPSRSRAGRRMDVLFPTQDQIAVMSLAAGRLRQRRHTSAIIGYPWVLGLHLSERCATVPGTRIGKQARV